MNKSTMLRNFTQANFTSFDMPVFWEMKAIAFMRNYIPIIILLFGAFGNTMSLILFWRPNLRSSVSSLYLRCLAMADMLYVIPGSILPILKIHLLIHTFTYNDWTCSLFNFTQVFAMDMSAWILVLFSFDRFIAIQYPVSAKVISTKKVATIAMSVVAIIFVLKNSILFAISQNLIATDGEGKVIVGRFCVVNSKYPALLDFSISIWPWITISTYSLIPFFIMIGLNAAIIVRVSQADVVRRRSLNASSAEGPRMTGMTAMLVAVSITFLLLTTPYNIWFILMKFSYDSYEGTKEFAQIMFLLNWGFLLSYVNHSINFYLYCLTGRRFRQELISLIKCGQRSGNNEGKTTVSTTRSA